MAVWYSLILRREFASFHGQNFSGTACLLLLSEVRLVEAIRVCSGVFYCNSHSSRRFQVRAHTTDRHARALSDVMHCRPMRRGGGRGGACLWPYCTSLTVEYMQVQAVLRLRETLTLVTMTPLRKERNNYLQTLEIYI